MQTGGIAAHGSRLSLLHQPSHGPKVPMATEREHRGYAGQVHFQLLLLTDR